MYKKFIGGTPMIDHWEGPRKGWASDQTMLQVWRWAKKRGKEGSKFGWKFLRLPYNWREVGQSHRGVLKPKLPIRGVLHPSQMGIFNLCHAQLAPGSSPWKTWLQHSSAMNFKDKQLQPLVLKVRDLRGIFSWLPQTETFLPTKKEEAPLLWTGGGDYSQTCS